MTGAAEVSEHFHRVASRFTEVREFRFELIAADVHGDAAYSVGFEHFLGSFDGRAARGVAGDIAGDEYRLRAGLRGEPDGLSFRPAGPDYQVTAAGTQLRAQIGEALQHEAGPVRRGHQPGVHVEQRNHEVRLLARGGEGRAVAHPQVAGEQHDRGLNGFPCCSLGSAPRPCCLEPGHGAESGWAVRTPWRGGARPTGRAAPAAG